jgi:hypothetical protein
VTALFLIVVLLVVAIFGVASISQSHAAAQQAQAAIEASRAAQLASATNLALTVLVILLLIGLGLALAYIVRGKRQETASGPWQPGPNGRWQPRGLNAPQNLNDMLPVMLTMAMFQMLQQNRAFPAHPNQPTLPLDEEADSDWWIS